MRQNREDSYRIKSYCFLCINNQTGHLFMYNYVNNKIRKKAETKHRGTLYALELKGVTAVSRMAEKHTFYKNA